MLVYSFNCSSHELQGGRYKIVKKVKYRKMIEHLSASIQTVCNASIEYLNSPIPPDDLVIQLGVDGLNRRHTTSDLYSPLMNICVLLAV